MAGLDRESFLRPIAHRGLHDGAGGARIENSAPAFAAAIERGYGIECDIRPASGGLPVVFHDADTERLLSENRRVAELSNADLARLRYRESTASILRFAEFLEIVAGRVPLLVEIKSDWLGIDAKFLDEIARLSLAYSGPLALMSFDPEIMRRVRALAPSIPRGLVAMGVRPSDPLTRQLGPKRAFGLSQLLESGPVAPDFYAYCVRDLPAPVVQCAREVHGLPIFAWTVRTSIDYEAAQKWADAPIFEGLEPRTEIRPGPAQITEGRPATISDRNPDAASAPPAR
jgi:glycerophosphoryl diester phosphodiesterase